MLPSNHCVPWTCSKTQLDPWNRPLSDIQSVKKQSAFFHNTLCCTRDLFFKDLISRISHPGRKAGIPSWFISRTIYFFFLAYMPDYFETQADFIKLWKWAILVLCYQKKLVHESSNMFLIFKKKILHIYTHIYHILCIYVCTYSYVCFAYVSATGFWGVYIKNKIQWQTYFSWMQTLALCSFFY